MWARSTSSERRTRSIYLEFSTRKIAALGLDRAAIIPALQAQNAVTPVRFLEAGPERIALRVGGRFISEDTLRGINLRVNDRFFPLTDVATISRGYVDPPSRCSASTASRPSGSRSA